MKLSSILLTMLAMIAGFGVVYLIGAFWQAGFDIVEWHEFARFSVGCIGAGCSGVAGVLVAQNADDLLDEDDL